MIQYCIYIGDEFINAFDNLKDAEKCYNEQPSGAGRVWQNRRRLVKEETILSDVKL